MTDGLIVVDMQNDFLARGGYYDRRSRPGEDSASLSVPSAPRPFRPRADALVPVIERVGQAIARARSQGWAIALLTAVYDPGFAHRPRFLHGPDTRRHYPCRPGTWGARLIDPLRDVVREGGAASHEAIIGKHTLDGFRGTELGDFLVGRGIGRVYLAGVETHACVLATAMSAAAAGLDATIIENCVWSAKPDLGRAALAIFADAFGRTATW